jgi:ribosome assembly protein RRB1
MGKKSKRPAKQQQQQSEEAERRVAPNQRPVGGEEETLDNLRFQDPFADVLEDENMDDGDDDDDEGDDQGRAAGTAGTAGTEDTNMDVIQSWHPLMGDSTEQQLQHQALEMDPSAYKMYHTLTPDWPCLSFDLLRDDLGESRKRFPHSLIAAIGTQASHADKNQLTLLKLSDMSKLPQTNNDDEEDILGDDYDNNNDSEDEDSDEEENVDLDPILEHYHLPHYGGINRLRAMPQQSEIIATWSDVGKVHLYNVQHILSRFSASSNKSGASSTSSNSKNSKPFFTHDGHETEGYAMDWSTVKQGHFVSGDCLGSIHTWTPRPDGSYEVVKSYDAAEAAATILDNNDQQQQTSSVEDLQWSPTEATVFAAAQCGGYIHVYDTRAPNKAMLSHKIHSNNADVNVLSWNKQVTNLLATGGDDGTLCVWDLRHFGGEKSSPAPLARFSSHKTPITSVEWHPTDESMLAVSDDVGTYIYDLSVEEDLDTAASAQTQIVSSDVPPQLLFCHCGSQQFKEVHWHPQISSCLMTTALTGFSVFIPSNL